MDIRIIYDRQYDRIYRIAMLYLRNASDAEDAVQNVFLKFIEKSMEFRDEEHEKAWFITVTRNYCKDVLKAFWRTRVELGEIPENMNSAKEESKLLTYIMKLPAKYREVLYLFYYEEYSIKEMSQILKRNISTIQTQLATARNRLKKMMEEKGANEYV